MRPQTKGGYGIAEKQEFKGHIYDSKFEAKYASDLDLLQKACEIKSWIPHVNYPLKVNDTIVTNYEIDFVVTKNDGSFNFVETKGWVDRYSILRWKLFQAVMKAEFPNAKFSLIRQGNLWKKRVYRRKRSSLSY